MNGWLNWREIEKNNDWGIRDKDDATAAMWGRGAGNWEERAQREDDFNRRQVEAMELDANDRVLDVCCGPGPLTRWIAPKVRQVTACDFSESMLDYVREKAEKFGLSNVDYLQGNFYTLEPGLDAPLFDVAVTRHSPAQGDILRFSRWATRRCYSLMAVYPPQQNKPGQASLFIKSAAENGGELNCSVRPDGRLYGVNVHFNLLYDMGADPELRYVTEEITLSGDGPEDIFRRLRKGRPFTQEEFEWWRQRTGESLRREGQSWTYASVQKMAVLSWDPGQIKQ
ncbi:MAG: methyltransferase domain-containing protein [Firmicutes bacterium]|nr:methyltransferase domain-containing protein [Bacillota bacterium]